jgi:heme ABC exporter ATP-binding subunit CcmA
MIEARSVSKHFGRRKVLSGLDIKIGEGETVALLGPNGAGKTTLLRILATLSEPSTGEVFVGGRSSYEDPVMARKAIGFVGHSTYTYDDLTALENLRFFWHMYGLPSAEFQRVGSELLGRVGLSHRVNDRAAVFSKGMRQRLAIARALLHSPKVLLLDEPYSSLDQKGVDILSQVLAEERSRGCSILVVTHDLQRIGAVADRADILAGGRVAQSFDPVAIKRGDLEKNYRTISEGGIL